MYSMQKQPTLPSHLALFPVKCILPYKSCHLVYETPTSSCLLYYLSLILTMSASYVFVSKQHIKVEICER